MLANDFTGSHFKFKSYIDNLCITSVYFWSDVIIQLILIMGKIEENLTFERNLHFVKIVN